MKIKNTGWPLSFRGTIVILYVGLFIVGLAIGLHIVKH